MVPNELDHSIHSVDENACVRLLHFLEADVETGLSPIFLKSLHAKMGEWTSPPYSYKRTFLFIGERDSSSGMHSHCMNENHHPANRGRGNVWNRKYTRDSGLDHTEPWNDSIQAMWVIDRTQSQPPIPSYYSSWARTPVGR